MANRKRDVQILLWVTPEEKKMIRKRMILSKTSNMSVYLRKMAIDGMIVNTDTTYLKAMYQEMHKIGVNINQLAKVANTVGTATPQDIEELKEMVKKTVAYITNPDKTDEQNLVSSFGCSPETADLEFAMTAEMGKNNVMEKGDNLAWHMIISYHPNDLTDPKLAHEVSTKIADSVLKGKYEYVLTTHTDKKHIHSVRPDRAMRKAV